MSDLFRMEAIERAKRRRRLARGGEKLRRQRDLQDTVTAVLLEEISGERRERLVDKHQPLRKLARDPASPGGGLFAQVGTAGKNHGH